MKAMLKNICVLVVLLALGVATGTGAQRLHTYYQQAPRAGDYSALIAQVDAPLVLFSTGTCPYCKRAKAFLAEHRIAYRDVDVQTEAGRALFEQQGGTVVPLLMTSSMRLHGFSETDYRTYLLPPTTL